MTAANAAPPGREPGTVGLSAGLGNGKPAVPPLVVHREAGSVTLSPGSVYRIGRDPAADVVVDAPVVSWHHAQLLTAAGQWLIQDEGSTNGTFCGGLPVGRMKINGSVQLAATVCVCAHAPIDFVADMTAVEETSGELELF